MGRELTPCIPRSGYDANTSFCFGWWDEINKIICLEPVGTVPDHRYKGLARAAVLEAIRRVAALGAKCAYVGSNQEFYQAISFELPNPAHHWIKHFKAFAT